MARVVSLLPSATDIVVALGAADELVGVSHSCGVRWAHLPRLTSTWIEVDASSATIDAQVRGAPRPLYQLDVDRLARLNPDVIVSQSLCDVCAVPSGDVVEAVRALPESPQLVDLAPSRLEDVPPCFASVGAAIGRDAQADALTSRWQQVFERHRGLHEASGLRVAFLDWLDPPFASGHWVPDLIEWLGAQSVLARPGQPSFAVTWREIEAAAPDLIVAACCGFTEARASADANVTPEIRLLDGYELFSRPSPSLMTSLAVLSRTFAEFLHARSRTGVPMPGRLR